MTWALNLWGAKIMKVIRITSRINSRDAQFFVIFLYDVTKQF